MALQAQQVTDTITGKTHDIPEVAVKARRVPPSFSASIPLQQMNKTDLERLGISEVADAIRHFSGVSVKDYGGIGGLKTVSVRSLGAQHTAVSYDGVAVSDCQSGQVDISRFSLDNVSELTLNIGQSDNIYQTARMFASAGALSIETARPDFSEQPFQLFANLKTGSYGLANPSLLYAQKLTDRLSISAYADYLRADGNYSFKLKNGNQEIDSKRNNSDIETYRAEVNAYATLSDRQDLKAKFYLFDSERGLPSGVIYDNPYAAERLYDRNYFGQLKYENRFSHQWKLQTSGKFNYSWNRHYNNEASGITDYRYRQTEAYLSATLWHSPAEGLSFSLAQDFAYNYLSATFPQCQYPKRYTYLTAVATHYKNEHFSATASLLNTYITEEVRNGEASANRKRLSPAVSLSWKPFDLGLRFRASYKDMFRNPTFNDQYYQIVGNTHLKPESGHQFNVGTTFTASSLGILDYLNLSVDAYYGRLKNKIAAVPTMFIWKMMNIGKAETIGIDVNLAIEKELTRNYKLYLTGAYSFMQAEDISDRNSKYWRNQLIYTPKHSGSSSLTLENPYVNITYHLTYASERYTMSQNMAEYRIKPYTDHGVSLSHSFAWKKQSLRIQVDALNLSNKNYEIVRFYPMPGRNYKLTLNYKL